MAPTLSKNSHNEKSSQRTISLVKLSIVSLNRKGTLITLKRLADETKLNDETGKGVTAKTIISNKEAHELFCQNSPAYKKRQKNKITQSQEKPLTRDINAVEKLLEKELEKNRLLQGKIESINKLLREYEEQNKRLIAILTKIQLDGGISDGFTFEI